MSVRAKPEISWWTSRDQRLCRLLNRWGARLLVLRIFGIVSRLGDGAFWYMLMAALLAIGGERGAMATLHMACVGLVATVLYRFLKRWTRRPRPYRKHREIIARIAPLDEFSFPSGHTLHAVSFGLIVTHYFPILGIAVVPFAVLVAVSRIVLGLHYPSDVIAATVIGAGLAHASFWIVTTLPISA